MLADSGAVLNALRLPGDSSLDVETEGEGAERWTICPPAEGRMVVVVRAPTDPGLAANHAAIVEALSRLGFAWMPRPLAVVEGATIEEAVPGVSALSLVPPDGSVFAAMQALAALHSLPLREGDRWGMAAEDVLPPDEPPLHRLGFAAHERERALSWFASARTTVLGSPWGLAHGAATAANILLAPGRAWLTNFERAGFGPQLFDVSAFLLTAGLSAPDRAEAARGYAVARDLDPGPVAGIVDLCGILWGVEELLHLPRRSIALLGDDAAMAAVNTAAARIERGIRQAAGNDPIAAGIRSALWPS